MLDDRLVRQAESAGEHTPSRPFIVTYTKKMFFYDEILPETICIEDIAHALSHLCRFTGHLCTFHSVAQHSLLVSEKIPGGPDAKLAALLHDGAEAYTNDIASPLKKAMHNKEMDWEGACMDVYEFIQSKIQAAIYTKFGVNKLSPDVRLFDNAAGLFEAEAFMGLSPDELEGYGYNMTLRGLWHPWDPEEYAGKNADREFGEIEVRFLERFENLMNQLGRKDS
jgi:hypothetical protein